MEKSILVDKLKTTGVRCSGYGIIPKAVMLDLDLTIQAKAIYAYFASYSGGGESAFPGRDKILADLRMNKDAYYKHFKQLQEHGLILVEKDHSSSTTKFTRNIYTLVESPKKYEGHLREPDQVYASGITSLGYGFIPKAVMVDPRLSVKAKGLYAYYCAFTGSGNSASPRRSDVTYHLDITINSYTKYKKELHDLNYITEQQRHVNGKLGCLDIIVNDTPNTDAVSGISIKVIQCTKNQDTENQDVVNPESAGSAEETVSNDVLQDTKKQDTAKQDTKKQDTENQDAIINSFANNSNTITSFDKVIRERDTNKSDNNASPLPLYRYSVPGLGSFEITEEQHQLLVNTYADTDKLFLLSLTKLSQRRSMPQNIYAFILEVAIEKHWKEKAAAGTSSDASNAQDNQVDKLQEQWEKEAEAEFEKKVRAFMANENIDDYAAAEALYTRRIREEVRKKMQK